MGSGSYFKCAQILMHRASSLMSSLQFEWKKAPRDFDPSACPL